MKIKKYFSLPYFLRYSILWLFFTLPISFSFLIWDEFSYFSWVYSPWTSISITISDIFFSFCVLTFFLIILFQSKINNQSVDENHNPYFQKREKIIDILFLLLSISILIPIIFASWPILHTFWYLKFIWTLFFFLYIPESLIKKNEIASALLFSFLIQWAIAILQFAFQGSIGLHFLWEPTIAKDAMAIAKIDLSSWEKMIRAYWTMQHANILWISSVIVYFLSLYSWFAPLRYMLIVPIILSFSRTAWLLFWIILVLNFIFNNKWVVKKILIFSIPPILITIPLIISRINIFDNSFYTRIEQYWHSIKMLISNFLWVWFWNYTLNVQNYAQNILEPWKLQPVHNIFLLFSNEVWIISLALFLSLLFFIFKK